MLKLLLVCACVDVGFEVGFAEHNEERKTGKSLTLSHKVKMLSLSESKERSVYSNGCASFCLIPICLLNK